MTHKYSSMQASQETTIALNAIRSMPAKQFKNFDSLFKNLNGAY